MTEKPLPCLNDAKVERRSKNVMQFCVVLPELFLDNTSGLFKAMNMTLEDEMQHEIARLKKEIEHIDSQMESLNSKIFRLLELKNKDEHDLNALQGSLEENYIHRVEQESLKKLLGRKKLRA